MGLLVFILAFSRVYADTPKTGDLLAISGLRTIERWQDSNRVRFDDGDWYASFGALGCSLRPGRAAAVSVLIWGQGDILFFDPANLPPTPAGEPWPANPAAWRSILAALKVKGQAVPLLRTEIAAGPPPHYIGYLVRMPSGGSDKAAAQIFVAADGADREQIPLSLEVIPGPVSAILPTLVTTLTGALVGAGIGIGTFLWQQNLTRRAERLKKFDERKVEKSALLWSFFQNEYSLLTTDQNRSDIERAQDVQRTMIEEGLYAILLPETVSRILQICDPRTAYSDPRRVTDLHACLKEQFSEFMRA